MSRMDASLIRLDKRIFMRAEFDRALLARYTERMRRGEDVGWVTLSRGYDLQPYVIDGFHRVLAAKKLGIEVEYEWHYDEQPTTIDVMVCVAAIEAMQHKEADPALVAQKAILSYRAAELSDDEAAHIFGFPRGLWAKTRREMFPEGDASGFDVG